MFIIGLNPQVEDTLAIGQAVDGNERVILFVKMVKGKNLTADFLKRVKQVGTSHHVLLYGSVTIEKFQSEEERESHHIVLD